jgi:hypothetical protein
MSCGETCSTHGCDQSAGCAAHSYKANFTPLGEPIVRDSFRLTNLFAVVFVVICIALATAGAFA